MSACVSPAIKYLGNQIRKDLEDSYLNPRAIIAQGIGGYITATSRAMESMVPEAKVIKLDRGIVFDVIDTPVRIRSDFIRGILPLALH